ncbi:L-histidine N(alpha)-methyltransferase [Bradymonadaceae bacterium TMQ3]|uniref:L-histidine N(Alpha)-methyltransferase n=1 Tax=Lujinxingia sediminis TaxID=2480984 RepID=A0ABY0CVB4_9DELT|nr:L-histidine N(alpha)-methyltransferase [Lujinxingia sediminis]RDV36654.1 L-histidine N(alpha)-methyltransferase [Bradymonadaceae bacterium TMQ3]RVU46955.1 L-histidine N(alpha)-methyltransferase [Lujinxingia sediminis]TXC68565.1 L-histidine N(alpha)-methyltransferase [Bradymonadales bacterium TMQ1]
MSLDTTPFPSPASRFLADVVDGLTRSQKYLPCKYLYDDRGSQLFNAICELPEYYPTRTELALTERFAPEIAQRIGESANLIELGAGSGTKTRALLAHLEDPAAYIPVDISSHELSRCVRAISSQFPQLTVKPVVADYTGDWSLPRLARSARSLFYFPGSTIGNFEPAAARDFLAQKAALAGNDGALLIGVDLKKDPAILEAAYNDRAGITAEFNLNLLRRINRELNADFALHDFRHQAVYNAEEGRVEMHLISVRDQQIALPGHTIEFQKGESIITEHSYKYAIQEFARLAEDSHWRTRSFWIDPDGLFSLWYLETTEMH